MNSQMTLIAAIGTPLTDGDSLHLEGLESHLADQWRNGMTGVLVGGTMGAMQMLTDATYRKLVDCAIEFSRSAGEIMVGVGDTSLARTRERICFLNERKLDGVVVLTPFFFQFSQSELLSYFNDLANLSFNPIFLYDLPVLTKTKLELATIQKLANHQNIRGIKCSGELGYTRQLMDLAPKGFRVIVAQAHLVDVLMRHGVREHLDGVFALAPAWVKAIQTAAEDKDWNSAAAAQQKLSALLSVLHRYGVFQAFSFLSNAKGIPGDFMAAPMKKLTEAQTAQILAEPIVQDLLREPPRAPTKELTHKVREYPLTK